MEDIVHNLHHITFPDITFFSHSPNTFNLHLQLWMKLIGGEAAHGKEGRHVAASFSKAIACSSNWEVFLRHYSLFELRTFILYFTTLDEFIGWMETRDDMLLHHHGIKVNTDPASVIVNREKCLLSLLMPIHPESRANARNCFLARKFGRKSTKLMKIFCLYLLTYCKFWYNLILLLEPNS